MLTRSAARKRNDTAAILERKMLKKCDPMKHVNDDTINMIFSHFTPEELVSLERVSRGWQAALRSWAEIWGFGTCFPFIWTHAQRKGISNEGYVAFKRLVHHARDASTIIRIINGATGHRVYQADYARTWNCEVHTDLFIDTFAIVMSDPAGVFLRNHTASHMAITQMFSYRLEKAVQLAPLSTDVMIFPTHSNVQSWIVNPYTRVGFSIDHNKETGPTHAQSHVMTPTADEELLIKAKDLLKFAFESETPPALRQCLVPSDGVVIQLPKRPSKKRCVWVDFDLHKHLVVDVWFSSWWFTNKDHILYEFEQGAFVLEF
ncbi:hypothetical protein BJX68DRAFT_272418 [Aspergillus pseudodeflectus]|uniref:F-box domain-containing protein n=1 Tax=Aspergillus pseudodeflectus TaxID=176178 RepID=A0ABR4JFQ9_9EURO